MRCAVEVAPLRAEPRDDAEQVTQALRGDPLAVETCAGGWAAVRTAYDYPGWVRQEHLTGDTPLELARTFLRAPYEWGGLSVAGIDCSGLVHLAYRLTGRLVPRDASQQAAAGRAVDVPEPGDLVVYGNPVDHVAFWVRDGWILHATAREGLGVVEEREPKSLRDRRRGFARL
jgi:hypothetical protein